MVSRLFIKIDFNSDKPSEEKVKISTPVVSFNLASPKSLAYVVRWQLASRRSGSASTKLMSEISGTTAKPYKQKGTGNARQGSKRSVQFVGGRTCHGPRPRSYDFTIPKTIVKTAVRDALKIKLQDKKLVIFSGFGSEVKTSKVNLTLKRNEISNALIICDMANEKALVKSVQNLKNVKVLDGKSINAYDILKFDHLLVDETTLNNHFLKALSI